MAQQGESQGGLQGLELDQERNVSAEGNARRLWLELSIVIVFTLALTLPFIFRPVHMDDAGFLELARARQDRPLEIVLRDYTFFGQENEAFIDTHPPLISSYQALLVFMAGSESVTFLHLGFVAFPLITAISMYFLARRFTRYRLLATLLLMGSPGVVVMSHGLMSDLPGLSFWLLSIVLYLYGIDRKSQTMLVFCAVAITAGVFVSYQVLSVIPLLLVFAYLRRELSLQSLLPFILPISSFVSYIIWHNAVVGVFPRFSYGVGEPLAWYSLIQKMVSVALALGGAMIFTGVMMRVMLKRSWDLAVYATFLVPMWVSMFAQYRAGEYTIASVILSVLLMPVGILFIYLVYSEGREMLKQKRREQFADNVLLLLWLTGVLFYVVFLLPYSSIRYMLPLFPPAILLFVRLVETREISPRMVSRVMAAAVTLTTAIAMLVAGADYELASTYRTFARTDGRRIEKEAAADGGRVWFVGEFGFRYYMEQEGFVELPEEAQVTAGDIIIQSPIADPRPFSQEVGDRVELIETIAYGGRLPVRVTNFRSKAGFYGHFWGLLPFSFSSGSVEEFLVYRVLDEDSLEDD